MEEGTYFRRIIPESEYLDDARHFSQFLHHPEENKLRSDLINDLKSLSENYDYRNALFVDTNCNVLLFYPNQDTVIGDYLKPKLPQFLKGGEGCSYRFSSDRQGQLYSP